MHARASGRSDAVRTDGGIFSAAIARDVYLLQARPRPTTPQTADRRAGEEVRAEIEKKQVTYAIEKKVTHFLPPYRWGGYVTIVF